MYHKKLLKWKIKEKNCNGPNKRYLKREKSHKKSGPYPASATTYPAKAGSARQYSNFEKSLFLHLSKNST